MADQKTADQFVALANTVAFEDLQATLQQIVDLACVALDSCSMAGLTLLDQAGPHTAAASSAVALRVDANQYELNSGPCLDAYRHQTTNRIPATRSDKQWPAFSERAAAEGVLATLSLPLLVGGDGIGALNLYADHELAFSAADERFAQVFAIQASITLANARAYWRNEELRRNLEIALETRGVIDQAKGILMERDGINPDEAFEVLRRTSQRTNRKVREIAAELVAETQRKLSSKTV